MSDTPETPAQATETPPPEGPKGSVVSTRRVIAKPMPLPDKNRADAAAAAVAEAGGPTPQPRNTFHVNLVPMKRKHDQPGKRVPGFMADMKL